MPSLIYPKEKLLDDLFTSNAPDIVDVCTDEDHASAPFLLPKARRAVAHHLDHSGGKVVIVCQKGRKLSQGAAAHLRARGHEAWALEGGMDAWRAASYPVLSARALPQTGLWVCATGPEAHGLAHIIARALPNSHSLLEVEPDQVEAVADRFDAQKIDGCRAFLDRLELSGAIRHTPDTCAAHMDLLAHATRDEALGLFDAALRAARQSEGGV